MKFHYVVLSVLFYFDGKYEYFINKGITPPNVLIQTNLF